MRSFRLDRDSIPTAGGWIAIGVATVLSIAAFQAGEIGGWLAALGVVVLAPIVRDLIVGDRLAERFPKARGRRLLAAGLVVMTCGAAFLLASPPSARGPIDLIWLGPSFALILAFVVLNRKDRDIVE